MSEMPLDQVLKRVRQFTAKAEAPIAEGATPAEREATLNEQAAARRMADALMLKYAIDQAQLEQDLPAASRSKPGIIDIELADYGDMLGYITNLAGYCARHCRCKIRNYYGGHHDGTYWSRVYGYESDLRYFEILYTTLRLHMLGAFRVKPDPNKSYQINCYELHKSGLNWLDIAIAYGWTEVTPQSGESKSGMYVKDGERHPWSKVIAPIKRAYKAEVEARGEDAIHIPPGGMKTFRRSAAQGYTRRIDQRLREVQGARDTTGGSALVLRRDDLDAFFKEQNPDLFVKREYAPAPRCERCAKNKSGSCRDHPLGRAYRPAPFSEAGYRSGVSHANSASLNPEAGSHKAREIS